MALDIAPGRIFGIIGRSGAGKSSLLRTINRLEQPTEGRVRVDGVDIATLDARGLVALRRRVGMIFQHFNLLSAKTVWDNVALPLRVAGVPRAEAEARVNEALSLVGLEAKHHVHPQRLSGGQKQRVGIARALANDPEVLLCDEATSALDPETTEQILALLGDISRRLRLTILLITHEMHVIHALRDVPPDRTVVVDGGRYMLNALRIRPADPMSFVTTTSFSTVACAKTWPARFVVHRSISRSSTCTRPASAVSSACASASRTSFSRC